MGWFKRWYGANPLHLLALIGSFALAWYAGTRLLHVKPVGVAVWFAGAVVGHDLILMPLYALADKSVTTVFRHRPPKLPTVPWINYLRVPVVLSGLLLLMWFPLIFKIPTRFPRYTDLSLDPYFGHWLVITGALFVLSAVALAFRLRPGREPLSPGWPDQRARGRGETAFDETAYDHPAYEATAYDRADYDRGGYGGAGYADQGGLLQRPSDPGRPAGRRDWTEPPGPYGDPGRPPQRPRAPQDRRTQGWPTQDRQAQGGPVPGEPAQDWRTWDYSPGQSSDPGSGRHRQRPEGGRPGPGQPRSEPPWSPQQWPGQQSAQPRPGPPRPQPRPAEQWPSDGRGWAEDDDDLDLHWAEEASRRQSRPGRPQPGDGRPPWPRDR